MHRSSKMAMVFLFLQEVNEEEAEERKEDENRMNLIGHFKKITCGNLKIFFFFSSMEITIDHRTITSLLLLLLLRLT